MVNSFYQGPRKLAALAIAIVEIIIIIIFILTELGNVASNFFLTNVFAGSWCGLVTLIHVLLLLSVLFCLSGPTPAFVSVIVTVVNLVAYALLISFNGVFLAQPSTCIMTTTCLNQSVSTTAFSYNMSQNFFTAFNSLNGFKTYTLSQSKYLFQTIQISFGVLGFVVCILLLVLYYMQKKVGSANQVIAVQGRNSPMPEVEEVTTSNAGKANRKSAKITNVN